MRRSVVLDETEVTFDSNFYKKNASILELTVYTHYTHTKFMLVLLL